MIGSALYHCDRAVVQHQFGAGLQPSPGTSQHFPDIIAVLLEKQNLNGTARCLVKVKACGLYPSLIDNNEISRTEFVNERRHGAGVWCHGTSIDQQARSIAWLDRNLRNQLLR